LAETKAPSLEQLLLTREVEEFLYFEAELLDTWRYHDWFELLTDDIRYWMPLARNYKFGEEEREYTKELEQVAWLDEGKVTLKLRVDQLMTGVHWAEEPLSRMSHIVTNVRVTDAIPSFADPSEVTVSCRFLVYRNHLQDEIDFFIGKRHDVLRKVDGTWKLAGRTILLDQNILMAKNITFLF